jgi:hypothetical protein
MHAVCKFLFEHFIAWTQNSSLTDEHCKNLQSDIIKFCFNSIAGKSFNGRKHDDKIYEGFYPRLHHDSKYNLEVKISPEQVKLNKRKLLNRPVIGYVHSKIKGREFNIFDPSGLGQQIALKKNASNLPVDYRLEYFTIFKGILQTKDLVDQVVDLERQDSNTPKKNQRNVFYT